MSLDEGELGQLASLNLDQQQTDAVHALADVVRRAGGKTEFGHMGDGHKGWHATAIWPGGVRIVVDDGMGAGETADELAIRMLHNSRCTSCAKVIAAQDGRPLAQSVQRHDGTVEHRSQDDVARPMLCWWERQGQHWVRECGPEAPAESSREKLAQALIGEGYIHAAMIAAARAARYDSYLQDVTPFPEMLLMADLEQYGAKANGLRARIIADEFEGTPDESAAWQASPEGQETLNDPEALAMAQKIFAQVGIKPDVVARGFASMGATVPRVKDEQRQAAEKARRKKKKRR